MENKRKEFENQVIREIENQREFDRIREEHFKKTGHYHALGLKCFMPSFDIVKLYRDCEKTMTKMSDTHNAPCSTIGDRTIDYPTDPILRLIVGQGNFRGNL